MSVQGISLLRQRGCDFSVKHSDFYNMVDGQVSNDSLTQIVDLGRKEFLLSQKNLFFSFTKQNRSGLQWWVEDGAGFLQNMYFVVPSYPVSCKGTTHVIQ